MADRTVLDEIAASHWWDEPDAMFRAWLAAQPDEVQDMGLLDQIDLYAASEIERLDRADRAAQEATDAP